MNFKQLFGEEWYEALKHIIESEYWIKIGKAISEERKTRIIYPEKNSELFFKAFRTTPLSKTKVVILGQDPYHDGSYDGYAFSNTVTSTTKRISPSLVNILRELHDDIYTESNDFTEWITERLEHVVCLENWAKQGVLLINTAHTVVKGIPGSHAFLWKPFTKEVIRILLDVPRPLVFILWGNHARKIVTEVQELGIKNNQSSKKIIKSVHPSPFSAYQGFFGSKPFSKTNEFLKRFNVEPVKW